MEQELLDLQAQAERDLQKAPDQAAVEDLRVAYLGRKGKLTALLARLPEVPAEDRPKLGKLGNTVKKALTDKIEAALKRGRDASMLLEMEKARIDTTLPSFGLPPGAQHPVSMTLARMVEIFTGMGFWVEQGPEVENDFNNFEALNIGKDHPARDMQATFFITEEILLRTHTSPVQIRSMKKYSPPVRIISPGRVYRCDSDLSHSPMFHQVEGFMVDDCISFGDLKGVLMTFIHEFFGAEVGVRFRPSYFPFTEPSAEMDIQCVMCKGKGCGVCKRSGWLEILGCGMVHPQVLRNVGYDPESVTGFAFGFGVERVAMLKYRVESIRSFFENDLRFLKQFA